MPISTNIGGVLHSLSKVSVNDGGILKQIYGTPKDNLTLHWGGFTGKSEPLQNDFLIGEFTIDCPTYVSFQRTCDDGLNNLYTSIPSDIATQLGTTNEKWKSAEFLRFTVEHYIRYKLEKTVNPDKYHTSYRSIFIRELTKDSNGVWTITKDTFTDYNSGGCNPRSFDENKYYVYINKYAEVIAYANYASSGKTQIGSTKYLDFSEMTLNTEFKFQTLNGG